MTRLHHIFQFLAAAIIVLLLMFFSCQRVDDTAPILILNGDTLVTHFLNTPYTDAGCNATDETDGNISQNVYVDNPVNVDRIGYYTVTYRVVDEAGNEAVPVTRTVRVINQAYPWNHDFSVFEETTSGTYDSCSYISSILADSSVNYRIVFYGFACNDDVSAFADVSDTLLVLPYQEYADSLMFMSLQGSGWIQDSTIFLEYQRKTDGITSYWNATFNR